MTFTSTIQPRHADRLAALDAPTDPVPIAVVAALAGAGVALAGLAPTGVALWDLALSFAFGALVVGAAAIASPRATILLAMIAAMAIGVSIWMIAAWAAFLAGLVVALTSTGGRLLTAAAAGLGVQVLVRLPDMGFFGLPSVVAAVPVVVLLVAAFVAASRRTKRWISLAAALLLVAVVAIGVVGSAAILDARTDVERGVAAAQRGLRAARSGSAAEVVAELDAAEQAFVAADARASGPTARLLQLIPIAAQHQRAISVATSEGASIVREAAAGARESGLESVQVVSGSIDIDSLNRLGPRLESTSQALRAGRARIAEVSTGWLVPPLRDRLDELLAEVEEFQPEVDLGAEAVRVLPGLLGADRPKHYFAIFGTPAESREFGGLAGSWAILRLDQGHLSIGDSGRIFTLIEKARQADFDPEVVPLWFREMARPETYPQNVTSSPDFETVAAAGQELFGEAFAHGIDGYLYLDAWALIDLLKLTGPVDVPALNVALNADNAEQFFFETQYGYQGGERTDVFDGLASAAAAVLSSLDGRTLPGPQELGRVLGPAARAGRLQVITFDERANAFLESVKLLRRFAPQPGVSDFVGVVQTNGVPSKLDLYLDRSVRYDVELIGTELEASLRIDLTSTVPPTTPADVLDFTLGPGNTDGVNRVLLSVYTPHQITSALVRGEPAEVRETVEFGFRRYLIEVFVDPDGVAVPIELRLVGEVDLATAYQLEVWHQPLVNTDDMTVSYRGRGGGVDWSGPLVENLIVAPSLDG